MDNKDKISENENVSSQDLTQMLHRTLDEKMDAQRVILVGGEINFPEVKFPEMKMQEPIIIEKEVIRIEYVDKPIIIASEVKVEYIDRPIIVEKEIVKYIDKPMIVEKETIIYVDKPVIIESVKEIYKQEKMQIIAKVCMVVQTLALLGLFITHVIK